MAIDTLRRVIFVECSNEIIMIMSFSLKLESFLKFFAITWLFCLVSIPLGVLEWLKLVAFLGFCFVFVLNFINLKISIVILSNLFFWFGVVFFQSLNNYLSFSDDSFVLIQLRAIFIMLVSIFMYSVIVKNRVLKHYDLIYYFVRFCIFYVLFKLLVTFFVFYDPSYLEIIEMKDFAVSGNLGDSALIRFVFINDYFLPLSFYFVAKWKLFGGWLRFSLLFLIFLTCFASMTRFIWGFSIVVALISLNKKGLIFIFSFTILSLFYINEYTDIAIFDALDDRFFVEGASSSDVKVEQFRFLSRDFLNNIYFGKGLGSYVVDYLRNDRLKYGYEVFHMLLLMQFGIFIYLIALCNIFFYMYCYMRKMNLKNKFDYFVIYSLVIVSGFFNPTILSASAAIFFVSINSFFYKEKLKNYET